MKKTYLSTLVFALCALFICAAASLSSAEEFDCTKRSFGERVDKYDGFVKYMEKDGVAYYNYTGACRLPEHSYTNPALAYAAVDGKLYAQIISGKASDFDKFGDIYVSIFGEPDKREIQGDWTVSSWNVEEGDYTVKVKGNSKAGLIKGVVYYNPLKKELMKNRDFLEALE